MKFPLLIIFLFFILHTHVLAQQDTIFKNFSAGQTDDGILITFTIRSGITCSGVQIERSDDNVFFEKIYEFAGVCGGINTDESYSYTDRNPIKNKTAYYRLDLGSLGLYSDLISYKYIDYNNSGITVFPNPCTSYCAIYFSNDNNDPHEIELIDRLGKLIMLEKTSGDLWFFPNYHLNPGMYFYRIFRESELRLTGKVLVQ